jgi:hypothetical protein
MRRNFFATRAGQELLKLAFMYLLIMLVLAGIFQWLGV